MTHHPNATDHPELVNAVHEFRRLRDAYTSINLNDDNEFLDEQDKIDKPKMVYAEYEASTRVVEKWCKHYGISFHDAVKFTPS
jgi:hypothetical protein